MRLGEESLLEPALKPEVRLSEARFGSSGTHPFKAIVCGSAKCFEATAELERLTGKFVSEVDVCRSLDELSHRLRDPGEKVCLVVLVVADECEIDEVVSLADLLDDIRILLILLEETPRALIKAHTLRPRLLVTGMPDSTIIDEVLGKMLGA